ncbi:acyltransferase family protein [Thermoguttaceae bacterium LCP21S3_D4]|nr:acyltransferase [Lachnospiraceae bacterium]
MIVCKQKQKKERIYGLDFLRAIAALGIIAHHFSGELKLRDVKMNHWLFQTYPNGSFGLLLVTWFFILSGMALRMNYSRLSLKDLKAYFYKRFKTIFPMFWIAWFICYIQNVLRNGMLFYNGNPLRLLWTLFGLDGYVALRYPTYYNIGEWFLGALVLVYILYPLILKIYNKNRLVTIGGLCVLFLLVDKYHISIQTGPFRSITSCALSCVIGMLIADGLEKLQKKYVDILTLVIFGVYLFVPLSICKNVNVSVHIFGAIGFVVVMNLGNWIMKSKILYHIFDMISKLSYPIFLLQHVIILQVVESVYQKNLNEGLYLLLLLVTMILVTLAAWALKQIANPFIQYLDAKVCSLMKSQK